MKKYLTILLCISLFTGCTPAPEAKVIEAQEMTGEILKDYTSIAELTADADAIVAGETLSLTYFVTDNGIIWTKQTFLITNSLLGNLNTNSKITIYRMGGYASIQDYINSYEAGAQADVAARYETFNRADRIDQLFEYDYHPAKGMTEICFLQRFNEFDKGYARVGAYMGSFWGETNESEGLDNKDKDYVYKEPPISGSKLFSGYLGTYQLDEISVSVYKARK